MPVIGTVFNLFRFKINRGLGGLAPFVIGLGGGISWLMVLGPLSREREEGLGLGNGGVAGVFAGASSDLQKRARGGDWVALGGSSRPAASVGARRGSSGGLWP